MSSMWSSNVLKRYLLAILALLVLLSTGSAYAVGRVDWKSKSIKPLSDGDSWRLEITVSLSRAPDFANMPVKFEFLPTVFFDRSLVDGDKEVVNDVPLVGRQPMVEAVEMGFLDPRTAEIQKRTRFSFKLRRDRGYDAGRYRVTIRDGRNGQILGQPANITLEGQNELVDRRTMDFSSKPKKKEKKEEKTEEAPPDQDSTTADDAEDSSTEPAAGTEDYDSYGDEEDEPGEIKEKPGACGCRAAGIRTESSGSQFGLLLLLGLGLLVRARRHS